MSVNQAGTHFRDRAGPFALVYLATHCTTGMPSDHDHIQERLEKLGSLQQELQSLKDEYGGEGEVPTEEYQEIFRKMVQVIAEITPCPVHGMPEDVTIGLSSSGEEENYELELEGACCDALREEVSGKLQQLAM